MLSARVLYINMTGVTCEIMKNLVLAGVAAVICDDRPYPAAVRETPCYFFHAEDMEQAAAGMLVSTNADDGVAEPDAKKVKRSPVTVASVIQPRVDELNPLLSGRNSIEERSLASLPDDYFTQFDAIVASRLTVSEAKRISSSLQKAKEGKLFIMTDTFGLDGCAHLDFGSQHTYRREMGKDKLSDFMKIDPYLTMSDMLNVPLADVKGRWDTTIPRELAFQRLLMDYWGQSKNGQGENQNFIDFTKAWVLSHNLSIVAETWDMLQLAAIAAHPEVSAVSAVLGGMLGNEVIKLLTGKGEGVNNVMLFNGLEGGCRIFLLKPK